MEKVFSMASASSSSTYGNISCAIREHILSKFPYDYFKYINISTEMAFRNMYRQFGGNNSMKEFKKREKPYMVIRPVYQVNNPDSFLNDIPLTKNFDNIEYGIDKRHLFPIIRDPDKGYNLKFKMNRDRIEFDVSLTVLTQHQQLDLYKYIFNQIVWERPYIHRTSLEAMIPRSIVAYMSKIIDMDIEDPNNNRIPILLRYLNTVSHYPITYKIKNASGRDEFFMYYNHNTVVSFSDLSIDDGNRKNMVDDSYGLNFRVSVEFNLPGIFLLSGSDDIQRKVQIDLVSKDIYSNHSEFIPLFTLENIYNRYPSQLDGMKLYTSSIFNIEIRKGETKDTLDISPLFENEAIHVIRENITFNTPMNTFIKVIILKNSEELIPDEDYSVNWNKLAIDIFRLDRDSTYRLIVYINNTKLNMSMIEMTDRHQMDKSGL